MGEWSGNSHALAHGHHEPDSLQPRPPLPLARVNALLAEYGASASEDIGAVYYARSCPGRRQPGPHLVVAGERGPVTVFLLMGDTVEQALRVADERFEGRIVAMPAGGMAIVGERGEALVKVEDRLRRAIRWQL